MIREEKTRTKISNESLSSRAFMYYRSLETGFGDRISVYLNVVASAATVNRSVYVWWHQRNQDGTHHAALCLDEVNRRIVWPSNLHVLSQEDFYRQTVYDSIPSKNTIIFDKYRGHIQILVYFRVIVGPGIDVYTISSVCTYILAQILKLFDLAHVKWVDECFHAGVCVFWLAEYVETGSAFVRVITPQVFWNTPRYF